MRVTAIIPTVDRPGLLRDTLRSLAACAPGVDEVLVVDADPTETARPVVEAAAGIRPGWQIRHLVAARGACRQRNMALDLAGGDVVLFLDDDVLLERSAIGRLLTAFEDLRVVGATGHTLEPSPRRFSLKHSVVRRLLPGARRQGRMSISGYPARLWDVERLRNVEVMNGCWMAARADLARQVRFDEALEAPGGYASLDDEDFSYRLSRHGILRFVPDARVEHRNTGFTSADQRAFNRALLRNRVYAYRKNFRQTPRAHAHLALIVTLLFAHRALNGDGRGMLGLIDGLRQARAEGRPRR